MTVVTRGDECRHAAQRRCTDDDHLMQTVVPEAAPPPTLTVRDVDEDDPFDDKDDNLSPRANPFSPDSIREELARHIPNSWEEHDVESPPIHAFNTDNNTSVSTLDIGPSGDSESDRRPPPLPLEGSLDSSLSSHFSQIDLSPSLKDDRIKNPIDRPWEYSVQSPDLNDGDVETRLHSASTHSSAFTSAPTSASTVNPRDDAPFMTNPPSTAGLSSPRSDVSLRDRDEQLTPPPKVELSPSPSDPLPSTSSSPPSKPAALPPSQSDKKFVYRPQRATGPSMLEKVRSKTRPSFLPPKPKQEDNKHLADWQQMMKQSRAAGTLVRYVMDIQLANGSLFRYHFSLSAEKRRKAFKERRAAREKEIEESLPIWEREILPDWKVVHRNPEMRKLWWKGIPVKLRGQLWEKAVGNGLALSKGQRDPLPTFADDV